MKANELFVAYTANLGREAVKGEAAEFVRAFQDADPALLRRAIDEFFGGNPAFPRLPGLRAVYDRVAEETRAAAPKAAKQFNPANVATREEIAKWGSGLRAQLARSEATHAHPA